jgi:methylated-DNA-protein-cysteine methyltransferase-like protein
MKQQREPSRFDKILEPKKQKRAASFYERVYEIALRIPKGKVTSYGAIAETLGMKSSARLVGQAMAAVPEDLGVPAHRVINGAGALSAAHKFGGYERMRWLLEREGVKFHGEKVDMKLHFWHPKGKVLR